jgi:hypothetical protein
MRILYVIPLCALLVGCGYSQAARNEQVDDENCRKIISERNDGRPTAYKECRDRLMAYRQTNAISDSGARTTVNVNRY